MGRIETAFFVFLFTPHCMIPKYEAIKYYINNILLFITSIYPLIKYKDLRNHSECTKVLV